MTRTYFFSSCVCLFLLEYGKSNSDNNVTGNSNLTYEDEWVIRVNGGPQVASLLALQSGYRNLGSVLGFQDTYRWSKDLTPRKAKRGNFRFIEDLTAHPEILWAEEQKKFQRYKRDYLLLDLSDSEKPLVREKRLPNERGLSRRLRIDGKWDHKMANEIPDIATMFNDELWSEEWYLQDTRTSKNLPKLDLNVIPVYRLGINGSGVRVAVLDDGLEYTHDDLISNYDPEISYDINNGDDNPTPHYEPTGMNAHGTKCAGEIAMEANNRKCGVGVAFAARIGGIKLLDGTVNDRVEGEALGYRHEIVDIYTASWGPSDDGKSLDSPGRLATEALERGITEGRGGRGNIYVWASGNGGRNHDHCGCDGYVGSIYTISVGSASRDGKFPWYGEKCPATLATTYSSGAYHDQMIATTDLKNKCTTRHTGTSASAPLAAGIFALALQIKNNPGWLKNAAGFWINSRFGFGLLNAHSLVMAAQNWTTVPEKGICHVPPSPISNKNLAYNNMSVVKFHVRGCRMKDGTEIISLEHVQIVTSINYTRRGALQILLTSPFGTPVKILNPRKLDESTKGFVKWTFMSIVTWGEDPRGTWTLEIQDNVGPTSNHGTIEDFTMVIHGTSKLPKYRNDGPRVYNDEYNRIRKMNYRDPPQYMEPSQPSNTMEENDIYLQEQPIIDQILQSNWIARLFRS